MLSDAYERQFFRVVGGLGRVGRRRECGRAEQVTVMESDHHGYDQRHADAKPAPSGGCYHHPFVRRELVTDDFRTRGRANFCALFCWQDEQTGPWIQSVGCAGANTGGISTIEVSSGKCDRAFELADYTAHSRIALQEVVVPAGP